ncbi:MAG: glycosyltransferase family 39 protein [Chloroflexi bacterium]|nr:glycosyltransferase family 39 protein [Chloroflexota bacterium]
MSSAWYRPSRLTVIVLAATAINALIMVAAATRHLEPFADLATYYQEALNLVHGRGLSLEIKNVVNAATTHPPFPVGDRVLYPLIVAAAMTVFGESLAVANAVSALATALTALPLYALGRQLFGARAGMLTALLFTLNPFYHMLGIGGWTDTTATLFYYLALALLAAYVHAPSGRRRSLALVAGLSAALAALAREDAVVLVVALAGAWWLAGRRPADAVMLIAEPLLVFAARSAYLWQTFGTPFYSERAYALLPRWPLWYTIGSWNLAEYLDYVGGVGGAAGIRIFNYARFIENLFSDGILYATQPGLMPVFLLIAVGAAYTLPAGRARSLLWLFSAVALAQSALGIGYPGYAGNSTEVRHGQLIAPFLLLLAGAGLVALFERGRLKRALAFGLGGLYLLFAVAYLGVWANTLASPAYRGPIVQAAEWADAHLPADAVLLTRRAAETRYFSGRTVIATPSAPFADLMAFAQRHGVTHIVLSDADRNGAPNLVQGLRLFPQNFKSVYAAADIRIVAIADYRFPSALPPAADLYAGKTTGRPDRLINWEQLTPGGAGTILSDLTEGWSGALAAAQRPEPPAPRTVDVALTAGDRIVLARYVLAADALRPGDDLRITLQWQALAPMKPNYVVFVHLLDAGGVLRAQQDAPPLDGARPTYQWEAGEWIDDARSVHIPGDAAAGRYMIEVGLYDSGTGRRLPLTDAHGARLPDDRLLIDGIEVQP